MIITKDEGPANASRLLDSMFVFSISRYAPLKSEELSEEAYVA